MPIAQSSSKNNTTGSAATKSTKQHKNSATDGDVEQKQQVEQQNSGSRTPPEQPEFIKQTLVIIEKKVRNLDKRRQKLEEYRESARKGTILNDDQLNAVSRYDEVLRTLELAREMEKQFVGLANDAAKQQKKQMKKEQMEREEQMKERLKETHRYYSLFNKFDETLRAQFLAESMVTENELAMLNEFEKLIEPCTPGTRLEGASAEFADHFWALLEAKNKPVQGFTSQTTYAELKRLFDRLLSAAYWTSEPKVEEQVPTATTTGAETTEQTTNAVVETVATEQTLNQAVENMNLNENQQQQHQQQHLIQNEQGTYQNVDDYVIVTQSECAESLCHSKSPSLQPGQQSEQMMTQEQMQSKTFFTTLNQPAEQQHKNINEFINNCENSGFNFLQDSELSARQQQEQQEQQQQQMNNDMQFQGQQQENQFNHQPEMHNRDQGFRQQRGNNNRGGQQRMRGDKNQGGPRGDGNRGPRNNGYRGGNNNNNNGNNGPRQDGSKSFRQNGPRPNNNGHRNYPQQQPRGNFNPDMGQSQMA